jgi:hypothetical protein
MGNHFAQSLIWIYSGQPGHPEPSRKLRDQKVYSAVPCPIVWADLWIAACAGSKPFMAHGTGKTVYTTPPANNQIKDVAEINQS